MATELRTTSRVHLRPYSPADRDPFVGLLTDPRVMRHMNGPLSDVQADSLFERIVSPATDSVIRAWAAVITSSGDVVGHAALKRVENPDIPEMLFCLRPSHWHQGLGTEIALRLLDMAFRDGGFAAVAATVDVDHAASIRVLTKIGMQLHHESTDEQGSYLEFRAIRAHASSDNRC